MKNALMAALVVCVGMLAVAQLRAQDSRKERVFELRTYTAVEGKMEDMQARFRDHTCKLFEKHGMELVGFWTPAEGDKAKNTLIYVLAFPDREAAKKSWDGFRNDPEWHKARDASEKNGKIVAKVESVYMKPTDYSKMK
jgi:hypothetical protein